MLFFLCFSSPARVAFGWKPKKKKKKLRITKSELLTEGTMRGTLARCTCRLDWLDVDISSQFLQEQLRKKNFLLLRSLMEVDDRVNVSNHYSKKHDARHSWPLAKLREQPSCENQAEAFSKRVLLSSQWKPKAKILSVEIIERWLCWG